MSGKNGKVNIFVSLMLILGIVSLFLENSLHRTQFIIFFTNTLDYIIFSLLLIEVTTNYFRSKYKHTFLKKNLFELIFLFVFALLFIFNKYVGFLIKRQNLKDLSIYIIILRNVFIFIKVFGRVKRINTFVSNLAKRPAQTVLLSFVFVIIIGTLCLMMPIATSDHTRLGFINALFTSTSAVCVTGLIVVDTATRFSIIGKIMILLLIQIGGLGIMILSYFMMFLFRRKVSLERQLTLSYMLNETDMTTLYGSIKHIIRTTFFIELIGVFFLLIPFGIDSGLTLRVIFLSVFHSVSAFCNAGFSLFSDSLMGFKGDMLLNLTVATLIILGGLGFAVLSNLAGVFKRFFNRPFPKRVGYKNRASLNTRIVLITSIIMIFSGMLIIYALEHRNSLLRYDLKTQYIASFFQSVTLRTAGFNTVDFSTLNRFTYLFMILFMFIGGASGSTAGGIKVNTIALIVGYFHSIFKNKEDVTLFNHSVPKNLINRAFFITFLYIIIIFLALLILSMTEAHDVLSILFEVVSAIGTVGLSTGITQDLSTGGKLAIVILMFVGRVGPLTVVVSMSQRKKAHPITYPQGNIIIG